MYAAITLVRIQEEGTPSSFTLPVAEHLVAGLLVRHLACCRAVLVSNHAPAC